MIQQKYYKVIKSGCENTKITGKTKHLKNKNGQKNLKLYLFYRDVSLLQIKNGLELYSIEQGRETVDMKKLLSYWSTSICLMCIAGYTLRLLFSFQEMRMLNI